MTKIPSPLNQKNDKITPEESLIDQNTLKIQKNNQNTLKSEKMTKIPPKLKNYQNNHETYKMTKIPQNPKKRTKYP